MFLIIRKTKEGSESHPHTPLTDRYLMDTKHVFFMMQKKLSNKMSKRSLTSQSDIPQQPSLVNSDHFPPPYHAIAQSFSSPKSLNNKVAFKVPLKFMA